MMEPAVGEPMLYLYRLAPGAGAEYDRRHAAVWPELLAEIRLAGISDYTIYRRGDIVVCRLRARYGLPEANRRLADGGVQQRWSESLADLFVSTSDYQGEPLWMDEVFSLDP